MKCWWKVLLQWYWHVGSKVNRKCHFFNITDWYQVFFFFVKHGTNKLHSVGSDHAFHVINSNKIFFFFSCYWCFRASSCFEKELFFLGIYPISFKKLLTDSQTPITPLSRPKTGAVHLTRRGSRGAGPPSSAKKKEGRKGEGRKGKERKGERERET